MKRYMEIALAEAREAAERGEVPVGALVITADGEIIAREGNRSVELNDPSAHAEMLAIRAAGRVLSNYRLTDCTLYVNLEPCVMCAGAMIHARIAELVYGADDPKTGAIKSIYQIGSDQRLNHCLEVKNGLLAAESAKLLRDFFKRRRKIRSQTITER